MRATIYKKLKQSAELLDHLFIKHSLNFTKNSPMLIIFLFHKVIKQKKEPELSLLAPPDTLSIDDYKIFIDFFLDRGFQFVSLDQLDSLNPTQKYICLTFDDGYANNLLLLPMLKEYQIPCIFYVSPSLITLQHGFWWDILYRKRSKQGQSSSSITKEMARLNLLTHAEIEKHLKYTFGQDTLRPVGDIDRPFTREEVTQLSKEPLITIGNHADHHSLLTPCDQDTIHSEILNAQIALKNMTGSFPQHFSYPCGQYNRQIMDIVKDLGFKTAVTVEPQKIKLPLDPSEQYRLGRFYFSSTRGIIHHCESSLTNYSLIQWSRQIRCAPGRS